MVRWQRHGLGKQHYRTYHGLVNVPVSGTNMVVRRGAATVGTGRGNVAAGQCHRRQRNSANVLPNAAIRDRGLHNRYRW